MATYGVDLGTTYSCIAYVDDTGRPVVLKSTVGEDTTPSVVYFESPDTASWSARRPGTRRCSRRTWSPS